MTYSGQARILGFVATGLVASGLGGCQLFTTQTASLGSPKVVAAPTPREKDCLTRGMYFEANRSSDDGLLAVGTVIMNRLDAPGQPDSICGVVGAPRQFAQGVLSKPMKDSDKERVTRVATAILAGARHPGVKNAQHFHVTGRTYGYPNMHYVAATGGNRFYVKKTREGDMPAVAPQAVVKTASGLVPIKIAFASIEPSAESSAKFLIE